jgi:hypothetical protein
MIQVLHFLASIAWYGWVAIGIAWMFIGTLIGQASWNAWGKYTKIDHETRVSSLLSITFSKLVIARTWATLILFPGSYLLKTMRLSPEGETYHALPILSDWDKTSPADRRKYIGLISVVWPLKLLWNLPIILVFAITMSILLFSSLCSLLYESALKLAKKKERPSNLLAEVHTPDNQGDSSCIKFHRP